MITCNLFKNKKLYIVGLGRTGIGAADSMLASEAILYAWDDNKVTQENFSKSYPNIALVSPQHMDWENLDYIILSPGIPTLIDKEHEVVKYAKRYNVEIISDIDILYQACPEARYIAITGTNGKSTTTALIGHILTQNKVSCEVGGNIGISVLDLKPLSKGGIYVIETSSQQLSLIKFAKFNIALLLNITPDHIDYHGNMENYISAKTNIFRHQQEFDKAIISIDNHETRKIAGKIHNSVKISTHEESDIHIHERVLYDELNKVSFDLTDYKYLPGKHNEENIAFAYSACIFAGLKPEQIISSIKTFEGLAHRIELFAEKDGIKFINDSKATNADSTKMALQCFDNIYWIIGGIAKEGGIQDLQKYFPRISHAFIIGEAEVEFANILARNKVPYTCSKTLENAVKQIKALNLKSGVVLLSPACASWDQFKSYIHRGEQFKELIMKEFLEDDIK